MATQYVQYPSATGATTVTANQGTPGPLGSPWPVKPTDGTNFQSFTGANEAKVSVTQPLPTGGNVIGGVTGSGNFTVVQPTGTNLHAVVDSGSITAVQPTGANLHTVVDSGSITVSQATGSNLHAVVDSGTLVVTQPTGTNLHTVVDGSVAVTGTFFQATQPVSAAALPLPANAAQETGGHLASIDTKLTAPLLIQGGNSVAVKVDGSAVTQPVSGTLAVTGAFQAIQPVVMTGANKVNIIRNDYTVTSVTTGAYVQLVASTAGVINTLDVFDSSGQTLVFAVGAAASEVNQFNIYPGGNGIVELFIPAGSRLSVKAVSATASVGELDINTFS